MRKLFFGACIIFTAICSVKAQLPYLQNFETSMTFMPAGWSKGVAGYHPTNPGWSFNNTWPFAGPNDWLNFVPAHTYCAYVDDIDYNTTVKNNYDTLYTGVFSCASATHVFISFDLNFNNYTGAEVGTIAVSIDGGVTWSTAVTLPVVSDVAWHNGTMYDLSAFAAGHANVKVAFCWNNVGAVSQGYAGWGMAVDNINIYAASNYDLSVTTQSTPYLLKTLSPATFSGTIFNDGALSITSMNMNYSVNGGPAQTQAISGILGFNALTSYNWSMNTTPFTPLTAGNYTIKFWADHLNGSNTDQNNSNDTLTQIFMVIDSVQPKKVVFEEFDQASSDPCAYVDPNIDSVYAKNKSIMNPIKYHVNWPGTDYMNQVTQTPLVSTRVAYYATFGVPDGKLDGKDYYPGNGSFNSNVVQPESQVGSPFKITVTSSYFNTITGQYTINYIIKSFGNFASGLVAQTVLTVDSLTYMANQSTETLPQYVFPWVAEEMLPNASGTTLSSFVAGGTQTVSLSWTPNHTWGIAPKTHVYDSTNCHFTIFIQDSTGNPAMAIPAQYVYQSVSALAVPSTLTGLTGIGGGVHFELYPNPSTGDANIQFTLDNEQNVNVEVYTLLGEKVYGDNQGKMSSGDHMITIPGSNLNSGVYIVKFTTDNTTTTKRLVIQK